MIQPKPVRDVTTSDGRTHEVDIRQSSKAFTAWAFVDKQLIEGATATSQLRAVTNWKKQYESTFFPA